MKLDRRISKQERRYTQLKKNHPKSSCLSCCCASNAATLLFWKFRIWLEAASWWWQARWTIPNCSLHREINWQRWSLNLWVELKAYNNKIPRKKVLRFVPDPFEPPSHLYSNYLMDYFWSFFRYIVFLKLTGRIDRCHIVWKCLKMSHLNFSILPFSTNFCPIKSDLSGNTVRL